MGKNVIQYIAPVCLWVAFTGCSTAVYPGLTPAEIYAQDKYLVRAAASCTDASEYLALVCATERARAEALSMQKEYLDRTFSDIPEGQRTTLLSNVSGVLTGYARVRTDKIYKKGQWTIYVCVEYQGDEEELKTLLRQSVANNLSDDEKKHMPTKNTK